MAGIVKASDLSTAARLKQVAKLHFRGFSARKIAEEMGYGWKAATRDVALITDQVREFEDINEYLRDLVARTQEQLTQLAELAAEQWKLLDDASEIVVRTDAFGAPLPVLDPITGKPTGEFQKGPRAPGQVIAASSMLVGIGKQRAELLKLIGPKVDISIKLQLQEQTQARILEVLQGLAPDVYAQVYRELQIIAEASEQKALPAGDAIDAEFREADDGGD
jgi:hypothetical protein